MRRAHLNYSPSSSQKFVAITAALLLFLCLTPSSVAGPLPPQERTVISLYYFEGLTLKDIKSVLNVSESRVSQIHAQAVIRLRSKLTEHETCCGRCLH